MGNPGRGLVVTSQGFSLTGEAQEIVLSTDKNNYVVPGFAEISVIKIHTNNLTGRKITGLMGGENGKIVILQNTGVIGVNAPIQLPALDGGSVAPAQFASDIFLQLGQMCLLKYDGQYGLWRGIGNAPLIGGTNVIHSLPSTASTLARTDAAQTFTGTQTFGAIIGAAIQATSFGGVSGADTPIVSQSNKNITLTPGGDGYIAMSGTANSGPVLSMSTSKSGTFVSMIDMVDSGLTTDQSVQFTLGKAASDKNRGYMGFLWHANSDAANCITFGFYNADNTHRLFPSGGMVCGQSLSADPGTGALQTSGKIIAGAAVRLKSFTVATLPIGIAGEFVYVTNALGPTYGVTVVAGGTVVTPVFNDGTTWTCR